MTTSVDGSQRPGAEASAPARDEYPHADSRQHQVRRPHGGSADPGTWPDDRGGDRIAGEEVQEHHREPPEELGKATLKERPRLLAALRVRGRRCGLRMGVGDDGAHAAVRRGTSTGVAPTRA